MNARMRKSRSKARRSGPPLPHAIPLSEIALTHGRALWVLRQLGFGEGAESTFNYYVKSLRKLGVPFAPDESKKWEGRLAFYSYEHLVELSLALTLRTYGILPDAVLGGLVRYRPHLHAIYREAYGQRHRITKISIRSSQPQPSRIEVLGVYLDLQMKFSGRQLVRFGPPRLVRPWSALREFVDASDSSRPVLPVHISALAEQIAELAIRAPRIRRGRLERVVRKCRTEQHLIGK
jgi:hypothetical protein